MNPFKSIIALLQDPERDFTERKLVLMTIIAGIGEAVVLIGDILFEENWIEISVCL